MALIVIILAASLFWLIVIFNRLVRDRNRVRTAWSDIDIQLKRRYDLIPKLVAAVEHYAAYERATLSTLIELRSRTRLSDHPEQRETVEAQIGSGLQRLIVLAEAYPQLKADQSFLQLQTQLTEVENHIQYARRFYNGAVRNLNVRIESFPDLLIARLFRYTPAAFFQLDAPDQTHPPEI